MSDTVQIKYNLSFSAKLILYLFALREFSLVYCFELFSNDPDIDRNSVNFDS
jgi:hypothetical protein